MHGSKLELHVSQDENVVSDEQQEQTELLKHQLKVRDQLVDQLSAQLFQMVQDHPPALPQGRANNATAVPGDIEALQRQISFYQDQIEVSRNQIKEILQHTLDQSKSNVWKRERRFRLTASKAYRILHARTAQTRLKYFHESPPENIHSLK